MRILAVLLAIVAFGLAESGGRVFARELALYVNFSGIANVLVDRRSSSKGASRLSSSLKALILTLIPQYDPDDPMAQVTIYLDDDTEQKARAAAQSKGVSLSRWIADRVRLGALDAWPDSVRELAGAWVELPSAEQLRKGQGRDAMRKRL